MVGVTWDTKQPTDSDISHVWVEQKTYALKNNCTFTRYLPLNVLVLWYYMITHLPFLRCHVPGWPSQERPVTGDPWSTNGGPPLTDHHDDLCRIHGWLHHMDRSPITLSIKDHYLRWPCCHTKRNDLRVSPCRFWDLFQGVVGGDVGPLLSESWGSAVLNSSSAWSDFFGFQDNQTTLNLLNIQIPVVQTY